MKIILSNIKSAFLYIPARMAVAIFEVILIASRIQIVDEKKVLPFLKSGRFVMASWHGRMLVFFMSFIYCRGRQTAVMTSKSKDGGMAAKMQITMGYKPFRGSSSKGGKDALEKMSDYMQKTQRPAMLSVDGPKGPIYKVKPGVIRLASETGFPVIPISYSSASYKTLRSWDRCMFPRLFHRMTIIYGNPVHVPKDLSPTNFSIYIERVEKELTKITDRADAIMSSPGNNEYENSHAVTQL